jgi:hypothetical protein
MPVCVVKPPVTDIVIPAIGLFVISFIRVPDALKLVPAFTLFLLSFRSSEVSAGGAPSTLSVLIGESDGLYSVSPA